MNNLYQLSWNRSCSKELSTGRDWSKNFVQFIGDSLEDDWAFDRELYRMFFGDFEVREVPESEVPALKKIAKDWACNMPDWPEQLAKMQAKNVKNCS